MIKILDTSEYYLLSNLFLKIQKSGRVFRFVSDIRPYNKGRKENNVFRL